MDQEQRHRRMLHHVRQVVAAAESFDRSDDTFRIVRFAEFHRFADLFVARAQVLRIIHVRYRQVSYCQQFSLCDILLFPSPVGDFLGRIGIRMRMEQDRPLHALRMLTQGLQRHIAAHGVPCQHRFLHAAFVKHAHHHRSTERQGVDAFTVRPGRRIIRQAVAGHVDDDDTIMTFERLHQLVEHIHGFEIPVKQHQTRLRPPIGVGGNVVCHARLDRASLVFRVPNVNRYASGCRKEFHKIRHSGLDPESL